LEKEKPKNTKDLSEEAVVALRQNLSQPGKLILIKDEGLPYTTNSLLIIADSANNRILIVD
jgi:hypothetical protein